MISEREKQAIHSIVVNDIFTERVHKAADQENVHNLIGEATKVFEVANATNAEVVLTLAALMSSHLCIIANNEHERELHYQGVMRIVRLLMEADHER